jgi:hypothetical protein
VRFITESVPSSILIEFTGKEGLGRKKRATSGPTDESASEALQEKRADFVQRTQRAYEERRAEGRLRNAQKTLRILDEKNSIEVILMVNWRCFLLSNTGP